MALKKSSATGPQGLKSRVWEYKWNGCNLLLLKYANSALLALGA